MCLRIPFEAELDEFGEYSRPEAIVADEPVLCIKYLDSVYWPTDELVTGYKDEIRYFSIYQAYEYRLGERVQSDLIAYRNGPEEYAVGTGLHTYASSREKNHGEAVTAFLAVIPKGARYYVGRFCGLDSYASDALIVLREMKPAEFLSADGRLIEFGEDKTDSVLSEHGLV